MKTLKNITLTLFLAVATLGLQAKGLLEAGTSINFKVSESEKEAVIRVANIPADESLSFSIRDTEGSTLYSESLNGEDAFAKKFNFSHLSAGSYTIKVGNSKEYIVKDLVITESGVEVDNTFEGSIFPSKISPHIVVKDGTARVLISNRLDDSLKLTLYSKTEGLVFKDDVDAQGSYGKMFEFSNGEASDHYMILKGKNFKYTKEIK